MLLAWTMDLFGYSSINENTTLLKLISLAIGCLPILLAWLIARAWRAARGTPPLL